LICLGVMDTVKDVLWRWGKNVKEASVVTQDLSKNTWQHCKYINLKTCFSVWFGCLPLHVSRMLAPFNCSNLVASIMLVLLGIKLGIQTELIISFAQNSIQSVDGQNLFREGKKITND
jgi:hypothetical protein